MNRLVLVFVFLLLMSACGSADDFVEELERSEAIDSIFVMPPPDTTNTNPTDTFKIVKNDTIIVGNDTIINPKDSIIADSLQSAYQPEITYSKLFTLSSTSRNTTQGFAIYDKYPVSPGHALVIPKRHIASYNDLSIYERNAMSNIVPYACKKIDEHFHPDGYNVGINIGKAAGQSVFHCHMHVIPRYNGDVPNPKGGVRGVIPSKQKY